MNPESDSLNSKSWTQSLTPNPEPCTLNLAQNGKSKFSNLKLKTRTLNPKPYTLNPTP